MADNADMAFMDVSEDFVQLPNIKAAGTTSTDFDGLLETPIQLHEDLKDGCGGQLWPAGIVLAKYMLRTHKTTIRGKTILELGAGGGLTGLAVAAGVPGFSAPLWITDQVPMLSLMHRNIDLNNLADRVSAVVYDWGEAPPLEVPRNPDIILAADCVYFEPAFPLLQSTLVGLIGDTTVCYFCFKKRRRADLHFIKSIKKVLSVVEVIDDEDRPVYSRQNIFLYEIRKKATPAV